MSLILEALRKSEAERRRGLAPDVAMELPPAAAPRTRAMPAWWLPAALLAALALIAAWWWSQRDATPHAAEPTDTSAVPAAEPRIAPAAPVVAARQMQTGAAPPAQPSAPVPSPAVTAAEPAPPSVRMPPTPPPAPADRADVADIDATSLPPIKLSMHMWDESPARRFVILDGQRMGEGDRNGSIAVVAIERDGVVVERNGQRARISLP